MPPERWWRPQSAACRDGGPYRRSPARRGFQTMFSPSVPEPVLGPASSSVSAGRGSRLPLRENKSFRGSQRSGTDQRLAGPARFGAAQRNQFRDGVRVGRGCAGALAFPSAGPGEVMELIKRTAHTGGAGPSAATGYGVIDPVAALTYRLPPLRQMPDPDLGRLIARPLWQHQATRRMRNLVLIVVGGCTGLSVIVLVVSAPMRIRKTRSVRGAGRAVGTLESVDQGVDLSSVISVLLLDVNCLGPDRRSLGCRRRPANAISFARRDDGRRRGLGVNSRQSVCRRSIVCVDRFFGLGVRIV